MPVYFWNDPEGSKYRKAYFDLYPGELIVWVKRLQNFVNVYTECNERNTTV